MAISRFIVYLTAIIAVLLPSVVCFGSIGIDPHLSRYSNIAQNHQRCSRFQFNSGINFMMSFDAVSWENGFKNAADVPLVEAPVVQGKIPEGFAGTYYRNGPGRFDNVVHEEDGDAYLSALTFHEGKAIFRAKFLRSIPYLKEQAKGKQLYRGKYQTLGGLLVPGGDLRSKNVGNSNLIYFSKRLLALYPNGLPYKVEPLSLTCQERTDIGEQLPDSGMFCACPKLDPKTERLVAYTLSKDRKKVQINEFNSKYLAVAERTETFTRLFTDDFAVTENYYIFFEPAITFDGGAYGFNRKALAECCEFDASQPTKVHLIPRDPQQKKAEIMIDPMFLVSVANAYEDESGNIIIDLVKTDSLPWTEASSSKPSWKNVDWSKVAKKELCKLKIQSTGSHEFSSLSSLSCAAPFVNSAEIGLKHKFIYATASRKGVDSPPECGIVKINSQTAEEDDSWFPESESELLGECTFVKKDVDAGDEDAGWILATLRDTKASTSKVIIFDSSDLKTGPVCSIDVGYLPKGFSGSFAKIVSFPFDEIERASKLSEAFSQNRWNEVESSFSGLGIRAGDF